MGLLDQIVQSNRNRALRFLDNLIEGLQLQDGPLSLFEHRIIDELIRLGYGETTNRVTIQVVLEEVKQTVKNNLDKGEKLQTGEKAIFDFVNELDTVLNEGDALSEEDRKILKLRFSTYISDETLAHRRYEIIIFLRKCVNLNLRNSVGFNTKYRFSPLETKVINHLGLAISTRSQLNSKLSDLDVQVKTLIENDDPLSMLDMKLWSIFIEFNKQITEELGLL